MTWFVAATIGTNLIGGYLGNQAAGDAADAQAAASRYATDIQKEIADRQMAMQREMWQTQMGLQQPGYQGGIAAQNELMHLLGITPQYNEQPQNNIAPRPSVPAGGQYAPRPYEINPGDGRYYAGSGPQRMQTGNDQAKQIYGTSVTNPGGGGNLSKPLVIPGYATQNTDRYGPDKPGFGSLSQPFGMDQFEADPGYEFRISEGLKAMDRGAAARGGLLSGAALRAGQRYGQEMASQEYMNAFNRYQTERQARLNPLQSLMGASQTSTNNLSNAGQNYANNTSNILGMFGQNAGQNAINAGDARASGYIGQANSINSALGGIGSGIQNFMLMNALSGGGGYGAGSSNIPGFVSGNFGGG